MKALILVGGFGTRLRPLTLSVPKPLVDFANKPMVVHQIEALRDCGVTEVVLAINYQPAVMMGFIEEWSKRLGIKISCSQETEPMGTAGPIALAREILSDGEPFFVLNSDVICGYPLREFLGFHRARGAEASIFVTRVEDPSKYGVVVMDEGSGRVERFVEKPQVFVGDKINAGIYVLSPSVIDRIEMRPTSIEKEVFPKIAGAGSLYAMELPGFWMDIGQPRDYLTVLRLYAAALREREPAALAGGDAFVGDNVVDEGATVGAGCRIGPNVSVGAGCVIGDGVRLKNCCVMRGSTVKSHACVSNSIVGWGSVVGAWAHVDNMCVLGEDVAVKDELSLNGAVVLPHKEIKESVLEPKIIM